VRTVPEHQIVEALIEEARKLTESNPEQNLDTDTPFDPVRTSGEAEPEGNGQVKRHLTLSSGGREM
jgi:hypothetical protein